MAENRTSNVIKNSAASLTFRVISILSQFALRTAFIYLLGNEYTGISGLFTDILTVLSLMELGLDTSMVYALYKPLAQQDRPRIAALMNFYKKTFAVIGVIVLCAGALCVLFLDRIVNGVPNIKEDIRIIFMGYVLTSASSYFFIYKSVLLRADQKSRVISKWSAIIQILECLFEIGLLIFFRQFLLYLAIHFLATVLKNLILSRVSTKTYPQYFLDKSARLDRKETLLLFRDIMCLTAYSLCGVVINSTDSIYVSAFVGTVQVAIVGNYTLIINSIKNCIEQIVNAAKPSIGNMAVTSSDQKQEQVFERMNFLAFFVTCFCCACLCALLAPFVSDIWFDPSYKVSLAIIGLLVANFYIAVMVLPVESFRTANGLFKQGWGRPVLTAVVNIILDYFMGLRWGLIGIFAATAISRLLVFYDSYLVYKYVFKKKPWRYYADYFFKFVITVAVSAVTIIAVSLVGVGNAYLRFLLQTLLAVCVSGLLLITFSHRNGNFQYFFSMFKRIALRAKNG